jgi:hypothetical protein
MESVFVYRYDEIFSIAQLESGDCEQLPTMKKMLAAIINKRLRIKEIPDYLELAASAPSG